MQLHSYMVGHCNVRAVESVKLRGSRDLGLLWYNYPGKLLERLIHNSVFSET